MIGADLGAPYRGRYKTLRGGIRITRAAGHADHTAYHAALLPGLPPAHALPGDLVLVDTPDGLASGVVQSALICLLSPGIGLHLALLAAARRVLAVGIS